MANTVRTTCSNILPNEVSETDPCLYNLIKQCKGLLSVILTKLIALITQPVEHSLIQGGTNYGFGRQDFDGTSFRSVYILRDANRRPNLRQSILLHQFMYLYINIYHRFNTSRLSPQDLKYIFRKHKYIYYNCPTYVTIFPRSINECAITVCVVRCYIYIVTIKVFDLDLSLQGIYSKLAIIAEATWLLFSSAVCLE